MPQSRSSPGATKVSSPPFAFSFVGAPNRYGSPAFYELHVWAWKDNPNGMFVDWNPAVSCEEYSADSAAHSMHGSH